MTANKELIKIMLALCAIAAVVEDRLYGEGGVARATEGLGESQWDILLCTRCLYVLHHRNTLIEQPL